MSLHKHRDTFELQCLQCYFNTTAHRTKHTPSSINIRCSLVWSVKIYEIVFPIRRVFQFEIPPDTLVGISYEEDCD
ncbi:unnamed protein product [Allacma fusca]|uniref:Uncharacterized protein n=1 Tax=Allacma fusca TaxID=39272 RepID=A0A8J2LRP2_9HEXA|nr:unnamed protein product [Allacma fusca]